MSKDQEDWIKEMKHQNLYGNALSPRSNALELFKDFVIFTLANWITVLYSIPIGRQGPFLNRHDC